MRSLTNLLLQSFFFGSVIAFPFVLLLTWLLLCSKPVQSKVTQPTVEKLLQVDFVKKLLTID